MSLFVHSVLVVSFVWVAALRQPDNPSKEPNLMGLRNCKIYDNIFAGRIKSKGRLSASVV
jgi:hypothetical protein